MTGTATSALTTADHTNALTGLINSTFAAAPMTVAAARFLRRYIQAARRATRSRPVRLPFIDGTVDFLEWATNYVNQLDSLSNVPKNPDQWPEPSSYVYADDNAMKRWLVRLSGFDGQETRKLCGQNTEKADCES
jgi:hypothetical protein